MNGLIAWMANNRVAANLLMLLLLVGGFLSATRTQQEVFPEFSLDTVRVSVPYPGASPEEVEQGVLLAVENAVSGIDDVAEVTSRAVEGSGVVTVELLEGADVDEAVNDVKAAVDRITTLPEDSESPQVTELSRRSRVVSVGVSGDQTLADLQVVADSLEERLTAHPAISLVEIDGLPQREVAIEVPTAVLQAYGLTLDDVARQVGGWSVERSGGSLQAVAGDLRVRVADRKLDEAAFADIPIRTRNDGATVRLGDLATITSGYADDGVATWVDGERALRVDAYRIGDETPSQVSEAARGVVAAYEAELPATVDLTVLSDDSEVLADRISLLLRNAGQGLVLVCIVLALFLDLRTALWVAAGIPISFLGAFLVLPAIGVSINMISLFALLVVLGLVVDDAIVVGEQIYYEQERVAAGHPEAAADGVAASVRGTRRMVGPIIVAVLTTILAFAPMLGVPGMFGKVFAIFPVVVASVLLFSVVEAFLILPAHLSHTGEEGRLGRWVAPARQRVSAALQSFVDGVYRPLMAWVLPRRTAAIGAAVGGLALAGGLVGGGWVPVQFFPQIPGPMVKATAQLPAEASDEAVDAVRVALEEAGREALAATGGDVALEGVVSARGTGSGGAEQVVVELHLDEELLTVAGPELEAAWASVLDPTLVVSSVSYSSQTGPDAGAPVDVAISHPDPEVLSAASAELMATVSGYADLVDIENSNAHRSPQVDVRLNGTGEALGLSTEQVAAQVRSAYQGSEALREQDGRHERVVRVRLPQEERRGQADLSQLPIRLADGSYVDLQHVAELVPTGAIAEVQREDGVRIAHVTASLVPGVVSSSDVVSSLQADVLPELEAAYPGLEASMGGETEEMGETLGALIPGAAMALLAIFGLLAGTFRSYVQPLVVMSAIPFGLVGAVLGHGLMATPMSIVSMFGIVALSGVVVNDSLVLVDAANERLADGADPLEAIVEAGARRFRPILLTSLTTFLGLAPMLLETSVQAQFLIPMAISLAFGILFATGIVLVLVPAFFLVVEDVRAWFAGWGSRAEPAPQLPAAA